MEMLILLFAGVLGFAIAFALARGALDLLFSALIPIRPASASHTLLASGRKPASSFFDA
jgi:hypothetical protein